MSDDLSKLDLIELLALLEPIPEPAPVSLFPQTAGWLWLGIVTAALAALWARRLWLRHRADAYRRAALAEIGSAGGDPVILSQILRRTALVAYPREDVASLYGDAWLAFLDRAVGGSAFSAGPGRAFAQAPYAREDRREAALEGLATDWVRRHRRAQARLGP